MEIGSERLKLTPDIEPEQVIPSVVDLRLSNQFTSFRCSIQRVETGSGCNLQRRRCV